MSEPQGIRVDICGHEYVLDKVNIYTRQWVEVDRR